MKGTEYLKEISISNPAHRLNILKNTFSDPDLEEVKIFTFSLDVDAIKSLCEIRKDVNFYLYLDKNKKNFKILDIYYDLPNLEVDFIEKLHFKSVCFETNDNYKGVIFGSANFTKGGILKNDETLFYFNFPSISKLKYSNASFVQGISDKIYKETNIKVFDKKICKDPVECYNSKEYYKELRKTTNKLSGDAKIKIVSPNISLDLINDLFKDFDFDYLDSKKDEKVHSKLIYIEDTDNVYVGFGSSNFTFSGLGLADKYVKKEINIFYGMDKEEIEDLKKFTSDGVNYLNELYKKRAEICKSKRMFLKYKKEVDKINTLLDKLETLVKNKDKIDEADFLNKFDAIVWEIYNVAKKPKEDVFSKYGIILQIKDKIYDLFNKM